MPAKIVEVPWPFCWFDFWRDSQSFFLVSVIFLSYIFGGSSFGKKSCQTILLGFFCLHDVFGFHSDRALATPAADWANQDAYEKIWPHTLHCWSQPHCLLSGESFEPGDFMK